MKLDVCTIQRAPGKILITADGWTADTTSHGFLGMTAHWIDVELEEIREGEVKSRQKWSLQSAVVGFRGLSGGHDGENLGRYFMGLTDHVGITSKTESKVSPDARTCFSQLIDTMILSPAFYCHA